MVDVKLNLGVADVINSLEYEFEEDFLVLDIEPLVRSEGESAKEYEEKMISYTEGVVEASSEYLLNKIDEGVENGSYKGGQAIVLKKMIDVFESEYSVLKDDVKFIGSGSEGTVNTFRINREFYCVKSNFGIREQYEMSSAGVDDDIYEEYNIHTMASNAGVRTPTPAMYSYVSLGDDLHHESFAMEEVRDVVDGVKMETSKNGDLTKVGEIKNLENFEEAIDDLKDSLDKMHSVGIIHSDLHMSNVLIKKIDNDGSQRYEINVIDFGRSYCLDTTDLRGIMEGVQDDNKVIGELRAKFLKRR
jgi:hypothetical protein